MSFVDEQEKKIQEEQKHARIGSCIAMIFVPPLILAICYAMLAFTTNGQGVIAHTVTYYTYNGIPTDTPYTAGLVDLAKMSCELDAANPKPADVEAQQQFLEETYTEYHAWYRQYWSQLNKMKWDVSMYPDPEQVPSQFSGAKIYFCFQQ